MTAFLPQQETFYPWVLRKLRLMLDRRLYQYDYTHVSPLAILKDLPITDHFAFDWLLMVGEKVLQNLANRTELEIGSVLKHHQTQHAALSKLLDIRDSLGLELKKQVLEALHFDGRFGAPAVTAKSLQEYADMFRKIGLPPIAKDFQDDRVFASMRIAGPNPIMLQRLNALDERLLITSAMFQTAVSQNSPGSKDSLDAAVAEGRLYLADYAVLNGAELGTFPNGQKYVYAPLALFVITGARKELLPVAIQCQQKPAADNPVITPNDGYNWLIAKTIVETADGNLHEASTHLGRTHLAMEAFVMASYRQLGNNHPLSVLLWPHFEGTLAINNASWKYLVSDRGAVDKLCGGTIQATRSVAAHGLQNLSVMGDQLPLTFARRGVDDRDAFPEYPFRDDSLLYWDAIHEWVAAYIRIYYQTDSDIQQDYELRAWGRELVSQDGGRLKGLPNNGAIQRIEELIDVVTFVIYTCSVQHAAVNFPQYDCMSYVPNMPLAGYRPAPTSKSGATEADFVAMLPTLDMAELQMETTNLLGGVHYTVLGQYGRQLDDPRVAAPLQTFQQRIANIGSTIIERNQSRRPYHTLAPSGIPQSINI